MHKTNPRRRPCTMADVEKAKREATSNAVEMAMYMVLWVLVDKHEATKDEVCQIGVELSELADSIKQKYINLFDLKKTLTEEYGVKIEMD